MFKYEHLRTEILEYLKENPTASHMDVVRVFQDKYGEDDVATHGFRRYVATIRYAADMVTVKEEYDGDGKLLKEVKVAIQNNRLEVPEGWRPVKIKNYGRSDQSVTWIPAETTESDEADLIKLVNDTLDRLTYKELTTVKSAPATNKTLIVYTSDKHVGSYVDGEDVYSFRQTHESKMEMVFEHIKKVVAMFGGKVKRLVLVDLGDALDGYNNQTVRGGHTLKQNLNNKEQVRTFIDCEANLISNVISANLADDYEYCLLTNDNHSGDFTYAASYAFISMLNNIYPNMQAFLMEDFLNVANYGRHTRVFTHGKDKSARKRGLPLDLDAQTELYLKEWIDLNPIVTDNVAFIKGDLHQSRYNKGKFFEYINCPALIGNTSYVGANFGHATPAFMWEIFDEDSGDVDARNFVTLKPQKNGKKNSICDRV